MRSAPIGERGAQAAAVAACVGWMAVSSGLIMLNKHLMSTDGFHFPMALSCLGMSFSSVASWLCCRASPPPGPCLAPPCLPGRARPRAGACPVQPPRRRACAPAGQLCACGSAPRWPSEVDAAWSG